MAITLLLMACHVKKYYGYLPLGLFSLVRPLMAQNEPVQFEFRHIQEKDGLSHNMVTSFLQDRKGFLWVGSTSGLNRYDGRQLKMEFPVTKKPQVISETSTKSKVAPSNLPE